VRSNQHIAAPEIQCHGKMTWRSKKDAKLFLRRLRFGHGDGKTAYRCPHCHGFHVGHA